MGLGFGVEGLGFREVLARSEFQRKRWLQFMGIKETVSSRNTGA